MGRHLAQQVCKILPPGNFRWVWASLEHTRANLGNSGLAKVYMPCRLGSWSVVVQSLSHVWLLTTPWTATRQVSQTFTVFRSLLRFMSIESVMPSNHLILCRALLLLPSIFPSSRVFSNESALCIKWPKYQSFSFSSSPSSEYSRFYGDRQIKSKSREEQVRSAARALLLLSPSVTGLCEPMDSRFPIPCCSLFGDLESLPLDSAKYPCLSSKFYLLHQSKLYFYFSSCISSCLLLIEIINH